MPLLDEIHKHRDEILAIAKKHGIKNVRVFGSVARGEETPESDVDFLINVTEDCEAFGFLDFQEAMTKLFGRECDIVFERGIFPPMRERIMREAKPL